MTEPVYALYQAHKYDGAHLVALFADRKDALRHGLHLKRSKVQTALDDYRLLGESAAEYVYRHCWANEKFIVKPLHIIPPSPKVRQETSLPRVVKVFKHKIWIESDFIGARHVMIQHNDGRSEPFEYASFHYDYRYTCNGSTMAQAERLALSLGAQAPVEHRHRPFQLPKEN